MTMHTPGPWRSGDRFNTVFGPKVEGSFPQTIATVAKGNEANARLIAAAPGLLIAAKGALAALSQNATFPADIEAARIFLMRAIAEAETGNW